MRRHLCSALLLLPCRGRLPPSRTLARSWPSRGPMEPVVVRAVPGESKLTISFCLQGTRRNMLRDQGEPLGKVLARISTSMAKGQGKVKKVKKNRGQEPSGAQETSGDPSGTQEPPPVKLFHQGAEVGPLVLNGEAWRDGAVLQVGELQYAVQRNPPTLTSAQLPAAVMAGYPVCPSLEVEFGNLQDCEYGWYKETPSDTR